MAPALNDPRYDPTFPQREGAGDGTGFANGLVIGLLIAIPLWMIIGIALVSAFQEAQDNALVSLAFMVAAVCEAILARRVLMDFALRLWRRWFPVFNRAAWQSAHQRRARPHSAPNASTQAVSYLEEITGKRISSVQDLLGVVGPAPIRAMAAAAPARRGPGRPSTMRQTVAFASLAIAYLHYYFWDISLQIASLNSLTVFVAVTPLQKFAA